MKKTIYLLLFVPVLSFAQSVSKPAAIEVPSIGTTFIATDYDDQDAANGNYYFSPFISYNTASNPGIIKSKGNGQDVPGQAHTVSGGDGRYHIECYTDPTKVCFSFFGAIELNHLAISPDAGNNLAVGTYTSGAFVPNDKGGTDIELSDFYKIDPAVSGFRMMSGGPKVWASYPGKATVVSTGGGGYNVSCDPTVNQTCMIVWVY